MKLVVISPESEHPREHAVLAELFAAGLERYHVRKPSWSRAQIESWLREVPERWRARLALHSHQELVRDLGLGGVHFRDEARGGAGSPSRPEFGSRLRGKGASAGTQARSESGPHLTSRSCHDLHTLRAALGHFDYVFYGPVFASISKPGYGPKVDGDLRAPSESPTRFETAPGGRRPPQTELAVLLGSRPAAQRRTCVLALGGITAARMPEVRALGFDGVAILGAIWHAANPVRAFIELQESLACHAA